MGECEMCGRTIGAPRRALIEGTVMSVCGDCVKFGVEQAGARTEVTGRSHIQQSLDRRAARGRSRDIYDQMEEDLVEDYSDRVRLARARKGWSIDDLGKQIMEKATILSKLEAGTYHPPDPLIAKLERALDIKLKEKVDATASAAAASNKPSGPVTLGDLIKRELEKGD